jgi:hypothetical protein
MLAMTRSGSKNEHRKAENKASFFDWEILNVSQ